MRILVTGTEGYIGARLAPWLMSAGHEVAGLDSGLYREGTLYVDPLQSCSAPRTTFKDLRRIEPADVEGFDAVVHLAELSNDPLGENRPEITYEINHRGSVRLAELARAGGVRRFVYASSCSVYGIGTGEFLDECSATHPQTAYARCKLLVERDLGAMSGPDFSVTFLRNATAYGPSPRMRFDIVLNDLCALAWTAKRIAMISDGIPWRPLVHVEDICEAVRRVLEAPVEAVQGNVLNVGATSQNFRIREIADTVARVFPGCEVTAGPPSGDNRSYRVSFEKIAAVLPGYAPRWTLEEGARELLALFRRVDFSEAAYRFRAFTRLRQLQYLRRTGQIDADLYWVQA